MNQFSNFIFKDYALEGSKLTLTYSLDNSITFQEVYSFDFDFDPELDKQLLDRALQTLFFMAGVSYYKTYLPKEIKIESGQLDKNGADFFGKTWQKGLGEFFYVNNLDPTTHVNFPTNSSELETLVTSGQEGLLVGIGGGKDSLLSVELLRNQPSVATWSVGHRSQLEPLIQKIGLKHYWVEREWDKQLLELNERDALNGHIPISAILACVGLVVAVLTGSKDIVVSNESSANEPNLTYKNTPINHQYSKSSEFEQDFQNFLKHLAGDNIRFYSFLRPLSELRIAELFARIGFEKYKDVFSSCNRAFVHSSDHIFWCGECPKCAFTFLIFTPFIDRKRLEELFHDKNLLLDSTLQTTYKQLLGITGDKPLDCVGQVKEARSAMEFAKKQYPELTKYTYKLPTDYDYKEESPSMMPTEILELMKKGIS